VKEAANHACHFCTCSKDLTDVYPPCQYAARECFERLRCSCEAHIPGFATCRLAPVGGTPPPAPASMLTALRHDFGGGSAGGPSGAMPPGLAPRGSARGRLATEFAHAEGGVGDRTGARDMRRISSDAVLCCAGRRRRGRCRPPARVPRRAATAWSPPWTSSLPLLPRSACARRRRRCWVRQLGAAAHLRSPSGLLSSKPLPLAASSAAARPAAAAGCWKAVRALLAPRAWFAQRR